MTDFASDIQSLQHSTALSRLKEDGDDQNEAIDDQEDEQKGVQHFGDSGGRM